MYYDPYAMQELLLPSPALPPRQPRASALGVPSATDGPVPDWRANSATIQRGLNPTSVYVPPQPRVGLRAARGAAGDPYAGYDTPFQVAGGGEYDLGALTQAESDWNRGLQHPKVLADRAQYQLGQGEQAVRERAAEADMVRSQAAMKEADMRSGPKGSVMALGQLPPNMQNDPRILSALGLEPSADQRIASAVPPGEKAPTGDDILRGRGQLAASDPLGAAVMEKFRPEFEQSANPGLAARLFDAPSQAVNMAVRNLGGPDLVSPLEARRDRARKMLGLQVSPRPRPGVPFAAGPGGPPGWRPLGSFSTYANAYRDQMPDMGELWRRLTTPDRSIDGSF